MWLRVRSCRSDVGSTALALSVLTALAFSEFTARGSILPQALSCLHRLVWLEIQIGRVPQVLAWIELDCPEWPRSLCLKGKD